MHIPSRRSALTGLITAMIFGLAASGLASPTAATNAPPTQSSPGTPYHRTELYFDSMKPDGVEVTPEEFEQFVDKEVTPNFPDGLTIVAGAGRWRGASGDIVKEHSYVVTIFYSIHDSHANGEIQEIRADYQRLYQQESVLRTDSVDQVSF